MMRTLALLFIALSLGGCTSAPCERLTEELCATRGEEDPHCQARRAALDEPTRLGDLQCKRALFLYQAEAGGGAQ